MAMSCHGRDGFTLQQEESESAGKKSFLTEGDRTISLETKMGCYPLPLRFLPTYTRTCPI